MKDRKKIKRKEGGNKRMPPNLFGRLGLVLALLNTQNFSRSTGTDTENIIYSYT